MKISKINEGKSATSKPFNKLNFDSTKVGQVTVGTNTYDQVQYLTGAEVLKTLGASGLGRAILMDDGKRPLGQCLNFGKDETAANFNVPSKGGSIEAVAMTPAEKESFIQGLRRSTKAAAHKYADELLKGADHIIVRIYGWTGADFVRA